MSGISTGFPFAILGESFYVWANPIIVKKNDQSAYFPN